MVTLTGVKYIYAVVLLSLLTAALKHRHAFGLWPIKNGVIAGESLRRVYSLTGEGYKRGMYPEWSFCMCWWERSHTSAREE